MIPRRILAAIAIATAAILVACDDDAAPTPTATSSTPDPTSTVDASIPGAADRVSMSGRLVNDLFPLQADFLGAVVRRDGLVSPCQAQIPEVIDGDYEITVMAEAEAAGCGAPGAEIILWAYIDDMKMFATQAVDWPAAAVSVQFDTSFSSVIPQGVAPVVTEFSGSALTADGSPLPPGTLVEAFIGDSLCGVGSTRYGDEFNGYIINVIADASVPGCVTGASINFRLAGQPARETAVNAPDPNIRGGAFTLTQQ